MSEPLPCPFCAAPAKPLPTWTAGSGHGGGPRSFYVECRTCLARGPLSDQQLDCKTDGSARPDQELATLAVERWNRRAA
jgi:hypothetical protein